MAGGQEVQLGGCQDQVHLHVHDGGHGLIPKIRARHPRIDFSDLVYPRLSHPVLEAKQKDILFSIVHGIYKNRARLHAQDRCDDPLCPNPEYHEEVL